VCVCVCNLNSERKCFSTLMNAFVRVHTNAHTVSTLPLSLRELIVDCVSRANAA
jgi:hypothetical protein